MLTGQRRCQDFILAILQDLSPLMLITRVNIVGTMTIEDVEEKD